MKRTLKLLLSIALTLALMPWTALPVLAEGPSYDEPITITDGEVSPADAPVTGSAEDG